MNYSNNTIIIPTLNEASNIGKLLTRLMELYPSIKIIVADDGSKDNTKQVVNSFNNIEFLDRSKEKVKGLTASIIDAAKKVKTENIIVMDADLQHPPEKVNGLILALGESNLAIGVREKITEPWAFHRKLMSKTAIFLGNIRLWLSDVRCNDCMAGFFSVKTGLFKRILEKHEDKFEKNGYKVLFDLLKYLPKDTKIKEISYKFNMRNKGQSKMGAAQIISFGRSLFR